MIVSTPDLSQSSQHLRGNIYYWKCDRPAAFHGTGELSTNADVKNQMEALLRRYFQGQPVNLRAGAGQGNHRTFLADIGENTLFVRIEDGPEKDGHLEVESKVQEAVRVLGIPAPKIHAVDASRQEVPFAWQLMDTVSHPDLNHWQKKGLLNLGRTLRTIGSAIARWQEVPVSCFGPFYPMAEGFQGYHQCYSDYFHLNLERHLGFLSERDFLSEDEVRNIRNLIADHAALLELPQGCLVHKDIALWNILGNPEEIAAYIDWDDAISGDEMDDLSLLGCFHDGAVVSEAVAGYAQVKALPDEYRRRFWLHLLRNMIVKAVIRVGAGYFDRTDGFFLIGAGSSGQDLRAQTLAKLRAAQDGLREDREISTL